MSEWVKEGWYRIGWSDGGMDWSNDGAHWYETKHELDDELYIANQCATDTHLPYAEYMGSDDEPKEQQ